MSNRSRFLIGACHLMLTMPLGAQDSTPAGEQRSSSTDSATWSAGVQAGKLSANEPPVALRSVVGFVAGVPLVFLTVVAVGADPRGMLSFGVSVGTISAAARAGSTTPPTGASEYASSRGPEFERGFQTGYADRLRSRRTKAAVGGAAAGALAGMGFLLWLAANLD